MDFNSLMKQAKKMQDQLESQDKEIKEREYVSSVASSIVEIKMNGNYEITSLKISEDFAADFTPDDREILEESVILAVNELVKKITNDKEDMLGGLAGSLNLWG